MTPEPSRRWPEIWLDRLRRRLDSLRGPVLQVWAWPGAGQGLLLQSLAGDQGLEVPPAALADPATLAAAADSARSQGLRYLLCRRWPGQGLRAGLDQIPSRPLLVFASRLLEIPDSDSDEILTMGELALTAREIEALWEHLTGEVPDEAPDEAPHEPSHEPSGGHAEEPSDEDPGTTQRRGAAGRASRRLQRATGGWLRPLELAAAAYQDGWRGPYDEKGVASLAPVREFLESEVLAPLEAPLRRILRGVALPAPPEVSEDSPVEPPEEIRELLRRGLIWLGPLGEIRRPPLLEALGFSPNVGEPAAPGPEPSRGSLETPPKPVEASVPPPGTEGEPPPACFRMQFFGPPRVWRQEASDSVPIAWSLRRALKIFAFLLASPDLRASRQALVEAAFRDEGLEAVRRNFHPTLSLLRRALTEGAAEPLEVLLFREGSYELNPDYSWQVDADAFLAHQDSGQRYRREGHRQAAVEVWQQAWTLYRGPFLEGFEESWVLDRRETLYRSYLSLLKDLGDTLSELDRPAEALDAYRALLVEDPLQEAVQVSVMGLYAAQGRRDHVRRQYDRLSKLLNEELGVEPLQATTLAYHRLMG